jgi:glycosyltransferase involved in cell wall biosynthesis
MKILLISDFFPDPNIPGGASTRVYHLMRELSKNHDLTLLTTKWPGVRMDEDAARRVCKEIYYYEFVPKVGCRVKGVGCRGNGRMEELKHLLFEAPKMVQSVKRHDRSFKDALNSLPIQDYDLIQVEDSYIAYRLLDIKKKYPHIPIVVDLHNVNALIEQRNYELAKEWRWRTYCYFEWKKMVRYEARIFRTFDLCLTCSEEDKKLAQSMAPKANFTVIPNGVDTEYFRDVSLHPTPYTLDPTPYTLDPTPNTLFFLGSNWPPNVDGILYFHQHIYPDIKTNISELKLYIVGNFKGNEQIKALESKDVILTGYVKDVREPMAKGAISIVPLRMGGGTRLKITEAMSMGKAIVSTSMGAEGIDVTNGENIIIADDPKDFANAVVKLLRNKEECLRLGANARKLAETTYDWKIIGSKLDSAYVSLLNTQYSILNTQYSIPNTKSRRILYLLDIFPAISETFILNEILELERRGYEILILARKKEASVPHNLVSKLKAKIVYLPDSHALRNKQLFISHMKMMFLHPINYIRTFAFALRRKKIGLFWFFKVAAYYAGIIEGCRVKGVGCRVKIDHIHSHFASLASCYAMLIGRILGKPYTFTVHGWYDLYVAPPADLKERALFAKKVITISEYNKRYLMEKFNIPAEKLKVVHCGVDLGYFNSPEPKAHSPEPLAPSPEGEKLILSVARLHPVKGLDTLIRACGLLAKTGNGFKCAIVGDGEERPRLLDLIDKMGLNAKVALLGAMKSEEVKDLYRKASVFVLPSKHETMGVTTMEAMACGVPVVSTNIYGIPELVDHNVNGFLISPGDDRQLADYLQLVLTDRDRSRKMGKMGRQKIEREFNLVKEVDKLEKVWFGKKSA